MQDPPPGPEPHLRELFSPSAFHHRTDKCYVALPKHLFAMLSIGAGIHPEQLIL